MPVRHEDRLGIIQLLSKQRCPGRKTHSQKAVINCHLSTAPIHNSSTLNCTKILLRPCKKAANQVKWFIHVQCTWEWPPKNFRCKTMDMICGVGLKLRVQRVTRACPMNCAHIGFRDNSVTGERSWTVVLQEIFWQPWFFPPVVGQARPLCPPTGGAWGQIVNYTIAEGLGGRVKRVSPTSQKSQERNF